MLSDSTEPTVTAGPDILIATTNPTKARRLRWTLAGLPYRLVELPPNAGEAPDEAGASFQQNAEAKASYWSTRYDVLVAASDGGMAVPALGERWNALRTARAAGPLADDLQRARYLLGLMTDLKGKDRAAIWSEGLALALGGRVLVSWEVEGTCAIVVDQVAPDDLPGAFWASSLCLLPELDRTLASLSDEELTQHDPTWSGLRELVQTYFGSGQADADLVN